jgi:adenosylcobinamide-GDP ribazoletransferase
MCVLSRWAMVFLLFVFPYAREEGKAGVFFRQRNRGVFISSTIIALVCVIALMGLKGVFIFPLVAISAYEMGEFMKRRLNGITGDVIGGISEVSEIIILVLLFTVQ